MRVGGGGRGLDLGFADGGRGERGGGRRCGRDDSELGGRCGEGGELGVEESRGGVELRAELGRKLGELGVDGAEAAREFFVDRRCGAGMGGSD